VNGPVTPQAVDMATGVLAEGHLDVLGRAVGEYETETHLSAFVTGPRGLGLSGVELVSTCADRGA
jgi:transposase-like protein